MITINDFKNVCENANTVEAINDAIVELGRCYGMNMEQESWDGTDNAAAFFESDNVISNELGHFYINLEPDEDSNLMLDDNGDVYAREEREILVSVFESYLDPASDDYLYSYTICVNGERKF